MPAPEPGVRLAHAAKILVCLRYGIGDVVMQLPALEALRAAAPAAHLCALGARPAIELLEADPRVDEIVELGRWDIRHLWDEGDTESKAAIRQWLEGAGFDLILNADHTAKAVQEVMIERGVISLEADPAVLAEALAAGRGAVESYNLALGPGWGLHAAPPPRPRLHLGPEEHAFAARLVAEIGAGGAQPVAVAPAASLAMKRWPAERFARVADWCVEAAGRMVLLLSAPGDGSTEALLAAMRRRNAAIGLPVLPLRKLAAVLARCAALVSGDTGVMHIAAAVDTPAVAVFGPTSPRLYLPPHPLARGLGGHVDCVHHVKDSLNPPGCWSSDRCLIAERSCVEAVAPGEVIAALRDVLR